MAMENMEYGFERFTEMTTEQIMKLLYTSDKDLAMKTHVLTPFELASMKAYADSLRKRKFTGTIGDKKYKNHVIYKRTADFMEFWIVGYLELMVSWKRLSRGEAQQILTALRIEKQNITMAQKLLSWDRKSGSG